MERTHIVVGIAGGSGAGKHRVIHRHLLPKLRAQALILEHDWYYYDLRHLLIQQNVNGRMDINYDHPSAYENTLLVHHLMELREGRAIEVYPYQKGIGNREVSPVRIEPRAVVIVDGMMVLTVPELVAQMDIKVYVHADDVLRLKRRMSRDMAFSSEEESLLRFERDVLPAHRRFVEPTRYLADFVVQNNMDGEPPGGVDELVDAINRLIPEDQLSAVPRGTLA